MLDEPGFISLEDYVCEKCRWPVYLEDGWWQCNCSKVGAYELNLGAHEIFKYWTDEKYICVGCDDMFDLPCASTVGTARLCRDCTRDGDHS